MTDAKSEDAIPRERDRATGEAGDLGVWEGEPAISPAEVWDGDKAVFSYPTHATLGEHFEEGDRIVVVFDDRAVLCTVDGIEVADEEEA